MLSLRMEAKNSPATHSLKYPPPGACPLPSCTAFLQGNQGEEAGKLNFLGVQGAPPTSSEPWKAQGITGGDSHHRRGGRDSYLLSEHPVSGPHLGREGLGKPKGLAPCPAHQEAHQPPQSLEHGHQQAGE